MTITADMEHLWHSHHAKIMRYVQHRLNDDVAEDLTQEVYLRAWEAMCNGNGYTKHASGWLYRIAHNLVIDTYRARERTPEFVELDMEPENRDADGIGVQRKAEVLVAESIDTPLEERVERTLLLEEVGAAVGQLIDTQAYVVMRVLEGYSYEEIGKEMGKPHEAVKQINTRAITNLRHWCAATVPPVRRKRVVVPRYTLAVKAQEVLSQQGPLLLSQLASVLNTAPMSMYRAIIRTEGVFTVVGYASTGGRKGALWGLQGIHDTQEAA